MFDLSSILNGVPNINTGRKQIEYIALSRVLPDPNNRYELNGIEELAANIEMTGLQQPLEVRPSEAEPGQYIITSGHRRHAALEMLGTEEVPCIVVEACASPALQELRLIFANSDTRKMSPAEQAWQAERIEALLYELKEQGYDFPGRMRDHVAALTKMSKSKLARLSVIRKNLKPAGLVEAFESGRLNEAAAYEIARCSAEAQELAAEQASIICGYTAEAIAAMMEVLEEQAEAARRSIGKIEADISALAEVKQTPKNAADFAKPVNDYLTRRQSEDWDYFKLLEENIGLFLRRLPVSVSRKDRIDEFKLQFRNSGGGSYEFDFDAYSAAGLSVSSMSKAIPKITRTWTEAYDLLTAAAMTRLKKELDKPACPNPDTGVKWQVGLPDHDCLVAGKFDCGGAVIKSVVAFKKSTGRFYFETTGLPLDADCISWVELPEEE